MQAPFGNMATRDAAAAQVAELIAGNEAAAAAGEPIQQLFRMLYLPQEGMFKLMPEDLQLACYIHEAEDEDGLAANGTTKAFMWEGQQYRVGDFVYLLAAYASSSCSAWLLLHRPGSSICLTCFSHWPRSDATSSAWPFLGWRDR